MKKLISALIILAVSASCTTVNCQVLAKTSNKIPVILDTDANNELDDQHAMIYLLFNEETFDIKGITTNTTGEGSNIKLHMDEAKRILQISNREDVALYEGANADFEEIYNDFNREAYDGKRAVEFIIENSLKASQEVPLVLLPVGKLTNIALALALEPEIAKNVRIVWLGSNFPEPGEYNQDNDEAALNYILDQEVVFEVVTVRYGTDSGSNAVSVTQDEINEKMPGLGPKASNPITGRHGGTFDHFGDYSVSLFEHIHYYSERKERALFDVVAIAILKNGKWGSQVSIPAPTLVESKWVERPANDRKIVIWENFNKEAIVADFFKTLEQKN